MEEWTQKASLSLPKGDTFRIYDKLNLTSKQFSTKDPFFHSCSPALSCNIPASFISGLNAVRLKLHREERSFFFFLFLLGWWISEKGSEPSMKRKEEEKGLSEKAEKRERERSGQAEIERGRRKNLFLCPSRLSLCETHPSNKMRASPRLPGKPIKDKVEPKEKHFSCGTFLSLRRRSVCCCSPPFSLQGISG